MLAEDMNRPRPGYAQKRLVIRKWLLNLRCHRITMVQATESRKGLNLPFTPRANFCRPTCWRVLRESKMSPVLMIVEHVRRHQPFEMPLIQDDHMVQFNGALFELLNSSSTVLDSLAVNSGNVGSPVTYTFLTP